MTSYPPFGLFNTQERLIHSSLVGQDFHIGIWLPFSYHTSDRTYPVLYVPDGEFAFPMAAGLIPTLIGTGEVPEMLLVGIAYHGITTWQEHGALRDRDFLPARFQESPRQSRLESFTNFFMQELFPLIEQEYRGSTEDRSLFGFSSGGFFAMHTLLTRPGLFRRLVATSCTWPGADELLLEYAQSYTPQPPVNLYLSVGALDQEQLPGFQRLVERLQDMQDAGIHLFSQVHDGEGHSSGVLAKAFLNGLKVVFDDRA